VVTASCQHGYYNDGNACFASTVGGGSVGATGSATSASPAVFTGAAGKGALPGVAAAVGVAGVLFAGL